MTKRNPLIPLLAVVVLSVPAQAGTGQSWLHPGFQNGVYHYAALGAPTLPGAFTIELWFRGGAQTLSPYPVLCQRPTGNMWNGEADYALLFDGAHLIFRVTTTASTYQVVGPANLLDGQWHHVAGVRTIDIIPRILLHVDGVLVAPPIAIAGNSTQSEEVLGVGGVEFTGYTGNYFDGDIDELRVWNVARTAAEIERDRWREVSHGTGLVVPFHFNDWYPGYLGVGPSYQGLYSARPNGVPRLAFGAGAPPILRGDGIDLGTSFQTHVTANFPRARGRRIAARPNGHFVVAVENPSTGEYRLEFMSVDGATPVYHASESILPALLLTAEGNRAYVVTQPEGGDRYLSAYNVTNPNAPTKFPLSIFQTYVTKSATMDPFVPNRLWIGGTDVASPFRSNRVVVYDTTNPFTVLINGVLPNENGLGDLFDVAASGPYAMASYNDGMVRTYSVTYSGDGGGSLTLVGEAYLGAPAHLVRLRDPQRHHYLAAYGSTISVLNESAQVLATGSVPGGPVFGVTAEGTRAYLSTQGGLRVIDVHPPAYPFSDVAWYVTDDVALSDPSFDPTSGRAYLANDDAGVYGLTVNSVVAVDDAPPISRLSLRAYPNPIRERSTIVVRVPDAGAGLVEIVDVTGRRVRRFSATAFAPGENRLLWDGRDDRAEALAPGIYFCRAQFGGHSETARLVLLE